MKYIFRYTILTQNTANNDNLTAQDLFNTLKKQNFSQLDKIQNLVETSRQAINSLIKNIGKSSQNNSENVRQIIINHFGQQNDSNVDELIQVWESQKQQVIAKMLLQSCKSQSKMSRINWQALSTVSSKNGNSKQKSIMMHISSINNKKEVSRTTVQLDRIKLQQLSSVLVQASQFLNTNFN